MTTRTPATPDETLAVRCLQRCSLSVASWDKRFVRQLRETELSEKERPQVWRLFIRYRRQIQREIVCSDIPRTRQEQIGRFETLLHYAAIHAAPDFRALNAKHEIQRRIEELKQKSNETAPHTAIA